MLTIPKPLSAGQARSYHAEEFGNARENYYTEAEQIPGEWHGRLAEQWGLRGEVREEHYETPQYPTRRAQEPRLTTSAWLAPLTKFVVRSGKGNQPHG
jgi:hypothetical protein